MHYRAPTVGGRCIRGLGGNGRLRQGTHVPENGRVLGENPLVNAEFDVTGDEYDGAVVVPELFVSRSRGCSVILRIVRAFCCALLSITAVVGRGIEPGAFPSDARRHGGYERNVFKLHDKQSMMRRT